MNPLIAVNAGLAGLFGFAAIHYGVQWWFSRKEHLLLVFSIQCVIYTVFCLAMVSFFRATTIPEAQATLDRFVTIGVLSHAAVLNFYAVLGNRRDAAYRWLVGGTLVLLAVLNQWAPLRGTVIELRHVHLPGGATSLQPIRTPPGASLALLYLAVLAVQGYGFFVARTIWKRDRVGAVWVALGSSAAVTGVVIALLVDFAGVRSPYAGAVPHAFFVVCTAFYLSRGYAARGARLAATLANLQAEQLRREEAEAARQRAMEAVVQAQRQELASHLAAGVAHDFNNVLNVISLCSNVLLRGGVSPEDQDETRQALAAAQAQGQALSRQLMALARPDSRSVRRFSLDLSIRAAVQTLRPALPRVVQLECEAPAALDVEADETEIQQVIYNLVLNARDAMPAGGAIQVNGGLETSPLPIAVVGGSLPAGRWATLSVTDSGPGVDPAIRDRIFDLFFTTKDPERGTGIGLATVLRIARASAGGVALESAVGRGATFKLYLPARGPSEAPQVSDGRLPAAGAP